MFDVFLETNWRIFRDTSSCDKGYSSTFEMILVFTVHQTDPRQDQESFDFILWIKAADL